MTIQAIQAMSKLLPETEDEMLKIDGVTKANFDKYGKHMLEITQQCAMQKLALHCEQDNNQDGENEMFDWSCSSTQSPYFGGSSSVIRSSAGGCKRGGGGRGTYFKRRKTGTKYKRGKRKKKTSPKKKSSPKKRLMACMEKNSSRKPGFLSSRKVFS